MKYLIYSSISITNAMLTTPFKWQQGSGCQPASSVTFLERRWSWRLRLSPVTNIWFNIFQRSIPWKGPGSWLSFMSSFLHKFLFMSLPVSDVFSIAKAWLSNLSSCKITKSASLQWPRFKIPPTNNPPRSNALGLATFVTVLVGAVVDALEQPAAQLSSSWFSTALEQLHFMRYFQHTKTLWPLAVHIARCIYLYTYSHSL